MSKQTAWLELFTGIAIDKPDDEKRQKELQEGVDAAALAQATYLRKKEAQAAALAVARGKFDVIKGETQKVLSAKIDSGPFKGKSFLEVEKGQLDEIDVHDVTAKANKSGKPPLPDSVTKSLLLNGSKIVALGVELREKRFQPDSSKSDDEPLFTNAELQDEFWTPVSRERIFPEGFIADPFSATQRMLDETNALYLEMVEQKRLAGELTPERDFLQDALETGGKLVLVGASALQGFDGKQLEMAKDILQTGGEVLTSLAELRGKFKDSEFADAASVAFDIAGSLTGAALSAANVNPSIVSATKDAIGAGGSAVLLGKTLNQVRTGDADLSQALLQMGDVLGKALAAAADGAGGDAGKALKIAADAAPALFKAVGLGTDLPELVRNGDYKSIVDRLADITKDVLKTLPGLDNLGIDVANVVDLGAAGLNMSIKAAFAVKKGEYLKALNGVVSDIGDNLGGVLKEAGLDSGVADQVVSLYKGAASAPAALELLRQDPPKVKEAISALAGGLESALEGTGNEALGKVGKSLALGVEALVTAKDLQELYKAEKYDEAVKLFSTKLDDGFKNLSKILGVDASDDSDDSSGSDDSGKGGKTPKPRSKGEQDTGDQAVANMKGLLADFKKSPTAVDPVALEKATEALKKRKEEEQAEADIAEAKELMAQSELDLKALTEAERTGAEASNIEQMIGDLLRERMVLKLASQIAQGGAAFLAQFLPGLGAASAGIKLAAALYAAGQRARQLDNWIKSQRDLQNAQSALSSSAANFVKNQGQQLAHYSAQAFFAAAQLAGEITKLAGPASGAGAIISAAASAGAAAEDLLMDLKDKYDVENGWKATQKALRNPGNRRLGLEARRLNPSLAKYSIAWGAIVLKDPLARGAMKSCGLTEASLNDPNADTHKVVKYLETFYEDDVTIYRDSTEELPDWVPAEIEVSLVCWAQFRRGAQGVSLTIAEASTAEGLFGEYEGVQLKADETAEALDAQQQAFANSAKTLRADVEKASKVTDGSVPPLPVIPSTDALVQAIDAHAESMRVRSDTAKRLYFSLLATKPEAADPGKSAAQLKAATAALQSFRAKADRVSKAAQADATGLESAKLEMQGTLLSLQRQIDIAKARRNDPLDNAPTGRKRSNADAPKPVGVGG